MRGAKSTRTPNICSQFLQSQRNGRGLRFRQVPHDILKSADERFRWQKIPQLLRELDQGLEFGSLSLPNIIQKLKVLYKQTNETATMQFHADGSRVLGLPSNRQLKHGNAAEIFALFDGVQIILRILFSQEVHGSFKKAAEPSGATRNPSDNQLEVRALCLDIIHDICIVVNNVASNISRKDKLIEYLFVMMEDKKTFSSASGVLEDLLASNRKIVDLRKIGNLQNLISNLRENHFATFCRIISIVIADIDLSDDRNTLLAQDKEEQSRAVEKSRADSNQDFLLSHPIFLSRMVKLASKPLSGSPSLPSPPISTSAGTGAGSSSGGATASSSGSTARLDHWIWNSSSVSVLSSNDNSASASNQQGNGDDPMGEADLGDIWSNPSLASFLPLRIKVIHEIMYKVEILYVLTLFLSGKYKLDVQQKLGQLKLIPSLCEMFDKLGWHNSSERFPRHNHTESEDCDCTPESALKIQFLRFVHSFCDHNEKKHLLLSSREVSEVQRTCEKYNLEKPIYFEKTSSKLRCRGERGLLTKIVNVLKKTSANNALRFWLSRAVEGFLRGRVSPPDQYFLIHRGLIEHLLKHILNPETEAKEILQSSFDLLGELMKFNYLGFERFNAYVTSDQQFEKFVSIMTSNVVDSNMFIRCIVLSLEKFSSSEIPTSGQLTQCRLSDLVRRWEHKMYLMYKLITSISVDSLTQENVSCLNTTLIFLMFAHNHGQLGQYLQAFLTEERAQKHPGLILSNLRELLEFWRIHYLRRGKDCSQLEQSSCISFGHWQNVVDTLLQDEASCPTSIVHYLSPWQQQVPSRLRLHQLHRDL